MQEGEGTGGGGETERGQAWGASGKGGTKGVEQAACPLATAFPATTFPVTVLWVGERMNLRGPFNT